MRYQFITSLILFVSLVSCGGSGGTDYVGTSDCNLVISSTPQNLSSAEVEQIIAQAVDVSSRLGKTATIAVSDRVGNVLGVFQMGTVSYPITVTSGTGAIGGLEGLSSVDSTLFAITKAVTASYLSSNGNAFSTRTAGFIIQQNYIPGILNSAAGPLYGVQFSQLPCGDMVNSVDVLATGSRIGPRATPLGLAADPGGLPLYKNGQLVGGIGVVIKENPIYTIDLNPTSITADVREQIAQSASRGFLPATCIRADRITAGGVTLRYSNSDSNVLTSTKTNLADVNTLGSLVAVANYAPTAAVVAGSAFGSTESGISADNVNFSAQSGHALYKADGVARRYAPTSSTNPSLPSGLSISEVTQLLQNGLTIANKTRAQIRIPLGSAAQVTLSVTDAAGNILGMVRTPDAPVFGTDVSLQKARTAAFFSKPGANTALSTNNVLTPTQVAQYISGDARSAATFFPNYVAKNVLNGGIAFSARAIGNIHRPYYPDGIDANLRGPLSNPMGSWSVFNVGLQLDLISAKVLSSAGAPNASGCTDPSLTTGLKNGMQTFPGGFPIYRDNVLVGALGVSGDGVDQDDMIAYLAIKNTSSVNHALTSSRSDTLAALDGTFLRYVQCPYSPFINSNEQGVCD